MMILLIFLPLQTQPSTIMWVQSCDCTCLQRYSEGWSREEWHMYSSESIAGGPVPEVLPIAFDFDCDGDCDLHDFAAYQRDDHRSWPKMTTDDWSGFVANAACFGVSR